MFLSWLFLHMETTLQTMSNSLTIRGTRHVKCYSYHACTSVTVSGGGRNATVHDLKPYNTEQTPTKYLYGRKYVAYNKQF